MVAENRGSQDGLAEMLISLTDWSAYRRSTGRPATGVGELLTALLISKDAASADPACDAIENAVAVQSNLFSASEPALQVLAASLADPRPRWVRLSVFDLMFLVLSGGPVSNEIERGNAHLLERCISRVRESLWLIVQEALADPTCKRAALDVLRLVDPGGKSVEILDANS